MISTVKERLQNIQRTLAGKPVTIVGVTKKQNPTLLEAALNAGLKDLGNNYVQEGEQLRHTLKPKCWHFIGHIQSRKIKQLALYDWIQSLDRVSIAVALQAELEKLDRSIDALVEVNLASEKTKSGIAPDQTPSFIQQLRPLHRIRLRGLMVLPPPLQPIEDRRRFFRQARELFSQFDAAGWDCLSMGTSDDYRIAVEEGATMIRLGTVLFGERT